MLSWKTPSAVQAVSIAFAVSIAAAQSLLLASAARLPKQQARLLDRPLNVRS